MRAPITPARLQQGNMAHTQALLGHDARQGDLPSPSLRKTASRLPTFVQGQVLAERFFVEEAFEATPHSTFCRAHDLEYDRVVLIKLLPRSDYGNTGPVTAWFRRVPQPVTGTGILGTLGVGVLAGGWPLMVCQYWRGRSLEARQRSGEPLTLVDVLQITRQVALALEEAHQAGHAHGNLRADDIWLSRRDDDAVRAMILGFHAQHAQGSYATLVEQDLSGIGDLLSLLVASLLPRQQLENPTAPFGAGTGPQGVLGVMLKPLVRLAARCHGESTTRRYLRAAEIAGDLARVEAVTSRLSHNLQ
jgi:serine/threonine protein kinase